MSHNSTQETSDHIYFIMRERKIPRACSYIHAKKTNILLQGMEEVER